MTTKIREKLWTVLLIGLILGVPLYYLASCVSEDMAVDSCLDGGGSWNYGTKTCDRSPQK
jgi:hypothetical protein